MKKTAILTLFSLSIILTILGFSKANKKHTSAISVDGTTKLYMIDATDSRDLAKSNFTHSEMSAITSKYNSVIIDNNKYFITEGDLLYDADEISYWDNAQKAKPLQGADQSQKLIGMLIGGDTIKWPDGYVITYCVMRNSFSSASNYSKVIANMKNATRDWEKACNVHFRYDSLYDNLPNVAYVPDQVDFIVREINVNGAFIAKSFFPNSSRNEHKLLIDRTYYTAGFNQVGVLRHELGHVLGFRHEHIRSGAPAVCPGEPTVNTVDLTKYDPQSVMHYFCGGVGSRELALTANDDSGAVKIYGYSKIHQ